MFVLSLGKWFGHFAVKRREEAANREKLALLEKEKEENLNKNNQQFSPVNFEFNSRKVLKENFDKEIKEEENVEDESEYEEVTDNDEEEGEEEVTDEESSISSAFAEFKIGGNGSILNENGMNGEEEDDDDEYETSVEEIIQLRVEKYPVKSPIEETNNNNNNKNISSTSNSPLDHTQPQAVGATVKAVIRTILRSGTELARIKLNNLAEFRKNEENKIIEELKPVNSSVLLSPMESEEEFSEEEWEEEEEIKEDEESLNKVNGVNKMAINKQIDEDSISIYSDALEGPPDLITIISVKNDNKNEIIEINSLLEDKKKEFSSTLPILRREIKMPVERSLEVKLRSGSVKEEKNEKEIKEEVDEEEMMEEKEEEWKKEKNCDNVKSFEVEERRKNLEENEGRKFGEEEEKEEEKIKLEDKEIMGNGWNEGRKEKEFKSEDEEEETIIVECTEKEDKITSSGGEICSMANSETTDDEEFEYEYITDEEGEIVQVEGGNLKGEKLEEKLKEKEELVEEEFEEEEEYEEEEEEEEDWDTRSEISQVEKEIERMRRVSVASSISRSPGYSNSEIGVSLNSSQKQCEVTENDDNSREKTPIALGQERQSEYNSRASSSSLLQNSFQSSKDQEETTESSQLNSKTNQNTPKLSTTTKILLPPLHPSTSKNSSPSFTFDSPLNKEDCQNNISKKEIKEDSVIKSPMMDEAAFTRLTSPLSKEINLDVNKLSRSKIEVFENSNNSSYTYNKQKQQQLPFTNKRFPPLPRHPLIAKYCPELTTKNENKKINKIEIVKDLEEEATKKQKKKIEEENKQKLLLPQQPKNFLKMETSIASGGANYLRDPCSHMVLTDVNGDHEDPRDYRRGGYHPVRLGELFNRRYLVLRKLGWGQFSTVWMCSDAGTTIETERYVALKIVKSHRDFTEAAMDEIKLLKAVRETDPTDEGRQRVIQLLDTFKIIGVNGTHICMIFEVSGCNLLKLIIDSNYQGLPLRQVKRITRQILQGMAYLHDRCKIIHTDIKPENVLVALNSRDVAKMVNKIKNNERNNYDENLELNELNVKIADLGNACWTFHHYTENIQTRQYRAPEVLLGTGFDTPADIWSVACMTFELATGDYLFEPHSHPLWSRDEDHLAHIIELLGPLPTEVFKRGRFWKDFFHRSGRLLRIPTLRPWPLIEVLSDKYSFKPKEAFSFCNFLLPLLELEPERRAKAAIAQNNEWLLS
uniref:non-specific serine/threonine protein kinase n=1 Tax=Meloidogyne enterolobii TaxID=390850 RepID=A0A6V7VDU7_MELEN|nr:unnamed protein product [Meloidogyne enterolobii]